MTQEQFNYITDWQAKTFPKATALSKVHHLIEEVNELKNDVEACSPNTRLEFADCFLLLFGAAKAYGMSYDSILEAIHDKMQINLKRNWGKPDANGVVKHE